MTDTDPNDIYFPPTGIYYHGTGPRDEFRAVVRIAPEARQWDGHTCAHGIATRYGGWLPADIRVTGRGARLDCRGPRPVYRVAVRVHFEGGSDSAPGDLVSFDPMTPDEFRAKLAQEPAPVAPEVTS